MSSNHAYGLSAERVAAWWLQAKGYRILARRLKTPGGEIDLVARRGKTVAVVEVKQRVTLAAAAGAILTRQQHRLQQAARFLLAQKPELAQLTLRFDAMLVNRWGWPRHVVNVWNDGS